MFQARHRGFDARAPAIDFPECIAALIKSSFLVFCPCWRVLKAGELPVVLVGLHWAAVPVGAFPACGKIKTRPPFRTCRRGRTGATPLGHSSTRPASSRLKSSRVRRPEEPPLAVRAGAVRSMPRSSARSHPRHWIASARPAIRASCPVRRGSLPISTCGLAASGCRWCRKPMRAEQRRECNHKALILLVFSYPTRPARAMVMTRKRCNSPPETTP